VDDEQRQVEPPTRRASDGATGGNASAAQAEAHAMVVAFPTWDQTQGVMLVKTRS